MEIERQEARVRKVIRGETIRAVAGTTGGITSFIAGAVELYN